MSSLLLMMSNRLRACSAGLVAKFAAIVLDRN
jgi:hypothetical protein